MKPSKKFRILYADDNEDHCTMLRVLLGFSGIDVVCTYSVAEAWRLAQNEHFDLYLLDVYFPDADGLQLCRDLRAYAPHKPIIMYSGCAFESDKQKGLTAGANAYLVKPYINDLSEIILSAIKLSKKHSGKKNTHPSTESQNRINWTRI